MTNIEFQHALQRSTDQNLSRFFAAGVYLAGLREKPRTVRCDIVEVTLPAKGAVEVPEIRHFENVADFLDDHSLVGK